MKYEEWKKYEDARKESLGISGQSNEPHPVSGLSTEQSDSGVNWEHLAEVLSNCMEMSIQERVLLLTILWGDALEING